MIDRFKLGRGNVAIFEGKKGLLFLKLPSRIDEISECRPLVIVNS